MRDFLILGNGLRKEHTVYGVQKKKIRKASSDFFIFISFRLDGDGSLVLQE